MLSFYPLVPSPTSIGRFAVNGHFCYAIAVASLLAVLPAASGQVITNVVRGGTTTNPAPVVIPNGLNNGALTFVDRTHVYQQVPAFLQGLDFIRVSNVDRNVPDYTLDVTLSASANLYLFIDFRVGDGSNTDPPTLTSIMTWVAANGFTTSGAQLAIDENNDGSIDNFFQVYSKVLNSGVTRLFEQNDGTGRNMYGVAAAIVPVPEPGSFALVVLGALSLCRQFRRRTSVPQIAADTLST